MDGSLASSPIPVAHLPAFVDVQDVSLTHRLAYEHADGGRFLVATGKFPYRQVCEILSEKVPEVADSMPKPQPGDEVPESYPLDYSKVKRELGIRFTSAEECFRNMARRFVQLEKQLGGA
ncbi:MAG: methylglyoxal reductase (NADPH-dependent) gre2 [Pycnora praestabilis]|nr:MAG: methylglyoxal reductase (NADPH-dependent) gre2 [Pycnora praestabilis]